MLVLEAHCSKLWTKAPLDLVQVFTSYVITHVISLCVLLTSLVLLLCILQLQFLVRVKSGLPPDSLYYSQLHNTKCAGG